LKQLTWAFVLLVFLSMGCAHRSSTSAGPTSDAGLSKQAGTTSSGPSHIWAAEQAKDEEEADEEGMVYVADPLYGWNLIWFHFNDKLYFWFLKPVASGYKALTPSVLRVGVRNFFQNVTMPIRFVSSIFQGKFNGAADELSRFVINTTIGVLGFMDPAKNEFGIQVCDEDVGQTLGAWGLGNGCYLVWPFLGPSTIRDTFGKVGDAFLNPVSYVEPWELSAGITTYKNVNEISMSMGAYDDLIEAALDPYEAVKDAYIQHREKKVKE